MFESVGSASLRRPAALSTGLLAVGVALLGWRQTAVLQTAAWQQYREHAARRAVNMAKFAAEHKHWPYPPLEPAPALNVRQALGYGTSTGLTVLLVGALALTLIALGRRRLWLPVAFGGLCLGQATIVVYTYSDWGSWAGVGASLAVIALAATPLLLAARGRSVEHQAILPARLVTTLVTGALLADWLWVQHFNGPVDPRPAPSLALLVASSLLTASPLRRRWLPLLALAALLAVPELQGPLGELEYNGWQHGLGVSGGQVGPLLFTLGVAVSGALVGQYGARGLALWRAFAGRGPQLQLRHSAKVAA